MFQDCNIGKKVLNRFIAMASFKTDSPNTKEYKRVSTLSSSLPIIERVATGSTLVKVKNNENQKISDKEEYFKTMR